MEDKKNIDTWENSIVNSLSWKDIFSCSKEDLLNVPSKEDILNAPKIKENMQFFLTKDHNISEHDIRQYIKDISYKPKSKFTIKWVSKDEWISENKSEVVDEISQIIQDKWIYFTLFFSNVWANVTIDLWAWFNLPLKSHDYWFDSNYNIHITPNLHNQPDIELDPQLRKIYDSIFCKQDIQINHLLESIGKIVNDSMLYDFDYIKNRQLLEAKWWLNYDENEIRNRWDITMRETYIPTWLETNQWVCWNAWKSIRNILWTIWLPEHIKYMNISSYKAWSSCGHDTTLLFDINTGNWAVINSKSPTKHFNLTAKADLSQLWTPYVSAYQTD